MKKKKRIKKSPAAHLFTGNCLHDSGDHGNVHGQGALLLALAVLDQRGAEGNIVGDAVLGGVAGDQQILAESVAGFRIIVSHWYFPPVK